MLTKNNFISFIFIIFIVSVEDNGLEVWLLQNCSYNFIEIKGLKLRLFRIIFINKRVYNKQNEIHFHCILPYKEKI